MDTNINYRETGMDVSRAEMIRLARESCARNFYGDSVKSRKKIMAELVKKDKLAQKQQQAVSHTKQNEWTEVYENSGNVSQQFPKETYDNTMDMAYGQSVHSTGDVSHVSSGFVKPKSATELERVVPKKKMESEEDAKELKAFHLLTVRCIVSLALLVGVIAIDKIQINYKNLNAQTVFETITSSKSIETIENFFVSLTKSK